MQLRSYTIAKKLKIKVGKDGQKYLQWSKQFFLQYFEKEIMFYRNILVQNIKFYKIYYKLYFYQHI